MTTCAGERAGGAQAGSSSGDSQLCSLRSLAAELRSRGGAIKRVMRDGGFTESLATVLYSMVVQM